MPRYTIRVIKTFSLTIEAPSHEAAHRYYAGPDRDEDLFTEEWVGTAQLKEINTLSKHIPTTANVKVGAYGRVRSN